MQTRVLTDKEYQQLRKDAKIHIPFAEITRSRRQRTKGEVSISFRHSYRSTSNNKRIDAVCSFLSKRGLVPVDGSLAKVVKVVQQYSLSDNGVPEYRAFYAYYARWNNNPFRFGFWEGVEAREARCDYADAGMGL